MTKRIYVASSWRNKHQLGVLRFLRDIGHQVYDFRNPPHGPGGFTWSEIDENWQEWTKEQYKNHLLNSARASQGFTQDIRGMMWCDTCVLVLPSGRSAHLEAGWCAGAGKFVITFIPGEPEEPDLMYLLTDHIALNFNELRKVLN